MHTAPTLTTALSTYLPTYIHTYLPTYLPTYLQEWSLLGWSELVPVMPELVEKMESFAARTKKLPGTYIHTYIHTCMHTYIHTYLPTYRSSEGVGGVQTAAPEGGGFPDHPTPPPGM